MVATTYIDFSDDSQFTSKDYVRIGFGTDPQSIKILDNLFKQYFKERDGKSFEKMAKSLDETNKEIQKNTKVQKELNNKKNQEKDEKNRKQFESTLKVAGTLVEKIGSELLKMKSYADTIGKVLTNVDRSGVFLKKGYSDILNYSHEMGVLPEQFERIATSSSNVIARLNVFGNGMKTYSKTIERLNDTTTLSMEAQQAIIKSYTDAHQSLKFLGENEFQKNIEKYAKEMRTMAYLEGKSVEQKTEEVNRKATNLGLKAFYATHGDLEQTVKQLLPGFADLSEAEQAQLFGQNNAEGMKSLLLKSVNDPSIKLLMKFFQEQRLSNFSGINEESISNFVNSQGMRNATAQAQANRKRLYSDSGIGTAAFNSQEFALVTGAGTTDFNKGIETYTVTIDSLSKQFKENMDGLKEKLGTDTSQFQLLSEALAESDVKNEVQTLKNGITAYNKAIVNYYKWLNGDSVDEEGNSVEGKNFKTLQEDITKSMTGIEEKWGEITGQANKIQNDLVTKTTDFIGDIFNLSDEQKKSLKDHLNLALTTLADGLAENIGNASGSILEKALKWGGGILGSLAGGFGLKKFFGKSSTATAEKGLEKIAKNGLKKVASGPKKNPFGVDVRNTKEPLPGSGGVSGALSNLFVTETAMAGAETLYDTAKEMNNGKVGTDALLNPIANDTKKFEEGGIFDKIYYGIKLGGESLAYGMGYMSGDKGKTKTYEEALKDNKDKLVTALEAQRNLAKSQQNSNDQKIEEYNKRIEEKLPMAEILSCLKEIRDNTDRTGNTLNGNVGK